MSGGHDAHGHDDHAPKTSSGGGGGGHSVMKGVTATISSMLGIGLHLFGGDSEHH